jgi:histidinol-phosphate aminotransferase
MTASRRDFLRFGVGAATISLPWPLKSLATKGASSSSSGDGLIRLYSNENAYGPSSKVSDAIKSAAMSSSRYPRLEYHTLIERIATTHQTTGDRILLGCGSTEVLRMSACAFLGPGKHMIHASPTFEALENYAHALGSEVVAVRLTPAYAHDLDGMLKRATASTALVYICNPNNPTASLTPRKDLEAFIAKLPLSTLVIIDEAYHHYAGASEMYSSFLDRPLSDERVIVTRTFSKVYGLAGLRLGYAVASPKVLQKMRKFTTEDNVNAIITQAALVALDDTEGVTEFVQRNENDRQEFFNQAMARALKPIDSHANFIMMNTFHPAGDVIDHFRKNKILIGRHFPPMDTFIRVSLGRPEEMAAFWQTWDLLPWTKNIMMHH